MEKSLPFLTSVMILSLIVLIFWVVVLEFKSPFGFGWKTRCEPNLINVQQTLETNYVSCMKEKLSWLQSKNSWEAEGFRGMGLHKGQAGALLAPCYFCKFSLDKSPSVKQQQDGGKWTCGVKEMRNRSPSARSCIVYSFGSRGEDAFEQRVTFLNPKCVGHVFVFDPTSKPLPDYHFFSWALAGSDGDVNIGGKRYPGKKLETIMAQLGHREIDILKFDVEGFEWDVFRNVNWSRTRIGQILVEIHAHKGGGGITLTSMLGIIEALDAAGFRQFSLEPVCASCEGQYELGFIHSDWTPEFGFNKD